MPFLWKCYIWVVVGVVGYIVEAVGGGFKQKPIDAAINRIKTSETHKLRIDNTSGRKRNKNRRGLRNCAVTRKHK